MVALSDPDPNNGYLNVAILTHTSDSNCGTQKESVFGLPGDGHVQQAYHTIHMDDLQLLPWNQPQYKKDHEMTKEKLTQLKEYINEAKNISDEELKELIAEKEARRKAAGGDSRSTDKDVGSCSTDKDGSSSSAKRPTLYKGR
jgi:hypothetical protein